MDFIFGLLFTLLFLLFIGLPYGLSIWAVINVRRLRREWEAQTSTSEATPSPPSSDPLQPAPDPIAEPAPVETPPPAPPPKPPPLPKPTGAGPLTEVTLGGKFASFAGMALVLIGMAFLIGYAIRHAWLGPGTRIVLGLLTGGGLIGLGHWAEWRGAGRLRILARALTGGGAALFYFCVFAAYAMYDLIGGGLAGIGLVASAAATLALAVAYRSQAVACIGVVGAFIMPALIGEDGPILFLLIYVAAINVPVMALGVYRQWQWLYNLAFAFTAMYLLGLLIDFVPEKGWLLLIFTLVYFAQFAGLGLIKLRRERATLVRRLDIIRCLINSGGTFFVIYHLMTELGADQWIGLAFLAMALVHIGLVLLGWRWFPAFTHDNLALLVGALTYASLALPVQLDGVWISVGWSIEGVILCWFALRARIPLLKGAAALLGFIGLSKALFFDPYLYDVAPALFLNARFAAGFLAAALLGVQGWLHNRQPHDPAHADSDVGSASVLSVSGALALLTLFLTDLFWTLPASDPWTWLLSSIVIIIGGAACSLLGREQPALARLALVLMALAPVYMIAILFIWAGLGAAAHPDRLFFNGLFASYLITLLALQGMVRYWLFAPAQAALPAWPPLRVLLHLGALAAGILLITLEWYRLDSNWNQPLITLWWASCAIALVVIGLRRHQPLHRYSGLCLFTLATAKLLLLDLAELDGLERIAAFIGVGVLLLLVSFLYQRAAAALLGASAGEAAAAEDRE